MNPRFISFHYILKNKAGEVLDSSHDGEPMTYIEGAQQIIPGLEEGLKEAKTGEKKHVVVGAEDAYGLRDERLVMQVPLTDLPKGSKVEEGVEYRVELDNENSHVFRVTEVNKTHATLDGNHPLAGEDLFFDVQLNEAREATQEEMQSAEEAGCCDHEQDPNHDHDHGGGHIH